MTGEAACKLINFHFQWFEFCEPGEGERRRGSLDECRSQKKKKKKANVLE
jgi:hypothetical protein